MMAKRDVQAWLDTLPSDASVGVGIYSLIAEANGQLLDTALKIGGFSPLLSEVKHKDFDPRNNDLSNIEVIRRCSDCYRLVGETHNPSCHRQGIVSPASDYREHGRDHSEWVPSG